jgi:hypothetical protein
MLIRLGGPKSSIFLVPSGSLGFQELVRLHPRIPLGAIENLSQLVASYLAACVQLPRSRASSTGRCNTI